MEINAWPYIKTTINACLNVGVLVTMGWVMQPVICVKYLNLTPCVMLVCDILFGICNSFATVKHTFSQTPLRKVIVEKCHLQTVLQTVNSQQHTPRHVLVVSDILLWL